MNERWTEPREPEPAARKPVPARLALRLLPVVVLAGWAARQGGRAARAHELGETLGWCALALALAGAVLFVWHKPR